MSIFSSMPPIPPLLFGLVVVSVLSSKVLQILQHIQSLPLVYFVLYSPTLFIPDVGVIVVLRLLLQSPESRVQSILYYVGVALALLTWFAASTQFGFFIETGSEVQWSASEGFLRDPAAMKILFSGIYNVIAAAAVIFAISFVLGGRLHSMTGRWVTAVRARVWETVKQPRSLLPYSKPVNIRQCSFHWLLPTSAIAFSLLFLLITRPAVPYNHLSGAIPLTMLDAFHKTPEGCRPPPRVFPLLDYGNGEHQRPHFDWSFGKKPPSDEEKVESPSWLPQDVPPGFERFETNSDSHDEKFGEQAVHCQAEIFEPYNPSNDPMKVSNLGDDILDPLREALKDVDVEHVMIMTLESARKELFPTQPGTPLYDALVKSHRDEDKESAMDKLAHMTLVSQMITGEYALDSQGKPANLSKSEWQDSSAEGMGGINVKGALTGSSLTLKSIMMGHCGVSPLPVDLLEEVNLDIYQPCFPQILELFNRKKNSTGEEAESGTGKSFLERPWKSIFMQPCTDAYDRQHILTKQMGFEQSITKETLMDENATYWHPNMETVNYFGYAEEETNPYLRDVILDAVNNNTRLFISQVTSSTHHPWGTPENYTHVQYTGDHGGIEHGPMNDYLNTIRYVDDWLGQVFSILDETGISNSTLIAIVGDHGQAFREDSKATGTFENGHISNFRVPLVFRHPQIPRLHISANATSLSILPTILDLLIQTNSLNQADSTVAHSLLPEYQGQSLIRPWKNEREEDGMPVWNIALINSGGSMIAITSSTASFRLIMPLKTEFAFRFTNLKKDPGETHILEAWTMPRLLGMVVQGHGKEAGDWVQDAVEVGRWWVNEQKRVWDYRGP